MKYLPLIFRNLTRNPRRSALTTLSIAVSLMVFSTLRSLPDAFGRILSDRAASTRLLCHNRAGIFYSLPQAYEMRIARKPAVEAVAAFTVFLGVYRGPKDLFPNFAVDHERVEEVWPDWGISAEEAARFKHLRTGCLVGEALLSRFGWHVGDHIMLRGTVYPVNPDLTIVGTLGDRAPPVALLFRRDYLEELLHRPGAVNAFWVKVSSPNLIPSTIEAIDREFANSSAETQTESELAYASSVFANFQILLSIVEALAVVVVITIGLVAANTAAASVRERRPEIAVMRAIGFRPGQLLMMILAEGAISGIAGAALGCAAAWGALKSISVGSAGLGPIAMIMIVNFKVMAEALGVGLLIGLGAALAPALGATRRSIVDTLRPAG